ncbi:substrate-binding domain-containing protein [Streptomyces sp. NPDC006617]|uniref:substrate-binding domain-containing protein n=1 Tax=Streptomyces sp. NPDC006617 TaxID=3155354 RepID=UPI0033B850D6
MPMPARRRRAARLLLLGTGLLLSGCGLYPADSGSSGSADDGPLTLGFFNGGDSRFHTCLQRSVEIAAKNNFARLVTANSRQDAATELNNIEVMIAREVDAIILQTVDTEALERDIEKAEGADIPVFLTSVGIDPDTILGAVVVDLEATSDGSTPSGSPTTRRAATYRSPSSRGRRAPPPTCSPTASRRPCPPTPRRSPSSRACSTPAGSGS